MKLIYYIALIICLVNVIYTKDGIFERTNCIADGNEICGEWNSLCCSGKSIQAEDAYDCWLLFPIIKKKIRVCGDKLKDKSKKDDKEKSESNKTDLTSAVKTIPTPQISNNNNISTASVSKPSATSNNKTDATNFKTNV
ncbi:hypothetical protein BCR36DRAFT_359725 [Piromyces finnis]|uniref:CBM1 domain-containing protein n=1 Tax=Piromyces finnis TaxID=1754191 RepID=A0A1Y1V0H4_9FUNG|nr:hypothetical protein BCR36DRAFT_359725 [Piromyces finnis]|eukprot:ORX44557.1 hypothetical protein BCR36DRAFT_359725 [Piromyces finnis]